jgi:4'-phosphopantetheinyl transferase EntD
MRRVAIELPWSGVAARAGAFGIPGGESRLSPQMRRVHQSRCARALAIELLGEQGAPDVTGIGKDPRGRPLWPANFVGSLSHTEGYAVAATAARGRCVALGVDVEPALPLPVDAGTLVLTDDERDWLATSDPASGRLVFCAKECVHKAIEPLRDISLEFSDVTIEVDLAAQRFSPRARGANAIAAFDGLQAEGVIRRIEEHWMLVLALFDSTSPGRAGRLG